MTPLDAFILGLVQGITEFLPVSSSGHLVLAQQFLGHSNGEQLLLFDLVCHMGTLLAILFVFYRELYSAFFLNPIRRKQIILATLPLFPLVLLLKPIKGLFGQIDLLGYFFLINSFILVTGLLFGSTKSEALREKHRFIDPFVIGFFQALAILPGISRSGSTITAARLTGWPKEDAVVFSFLIGFVAIIGGFCLEAIQWMKTGGNGAVDNLELLIAFFTSAISGFFALMLLIRFATKKNLLPFALWTFLVGVYTLTRYG